MSPARVHLRRPALASLASALIATAGAGAMADAAAAQAVQPGEVTGSVRGTLPPSSQGVVVVRAINAASGAIADGSTIGKARTFNLAVPAGAYAIQTTVVRPGRKVLQEILKVSVAAGQTRRGLRFVVGSSKLTAKAAALTTAAPARTAEPTAARAYVSADGTEVEGIVAYGVQDFTGGTGDWARLRRGIPALLQTTMQTGVTCSATGTANTRERKTLSALHFSKSKLIASGTRVTGNLIVNDTALRGTLTSSKDGASVLVTVTFSDQRTNTVFDTIRGRITKAHFTTTERALGKAVAERVCKVPPAYDLTLAVNGQATFANGTATGTIGATMRVVQIGGTGGQPGPTWKATGPLAWTNLAFQSSAGCTFGKPTALAGTWTATLTADAQGLAVDWAPSGNLYFGATSATIRCPGVADAAQPGPSLLGVLPNAQRLPVTGGQLAVTGNISAFNQGFVNAGTLKVTPVFNLKP